MKPFDLEAALRGELVVLRNGENARVAAYNPDARTNVQLIGWDLKGATVSWTKEGLLHSGDTSDYDIVGMATRKETRTMFVNVYAHGRDYGYRSKAIADAEAMPKRIDCIEIPYEVEL